MDFFGELGPPGLPTAAAQEKSITHLPTIAPYPLCLVPVETTRCSVRHGLSNDNPDYGDSGQGFYTQTRLAAQ